MTNKAYPKYHFSSNVEDGLKYKYREKLFLPAYSISPKITDAA